MKVLKFGGKSLANRHGLPEAIEIIAKTFAANQEIAVVLSARADTTDRLADLLKLAKQNQDYQTVLKNLKQYQLEPLPDFDLSSEFNLIEQHLKGIALLGECTARIKDLILAQGEIMSVKLIAELLRRKGLKAQAIDSRNLFKTDSTFGSGRINETLSAQSTKKYFEQLPKNILPIVTGYIASDSAGNTTTLGRNGSNYSASLLADYLSAGEVLSYTHLDGIFTANPDWVDEAVIIPQLSYLEANELASFGASILHAKTIQPLVNKQIRLRILNTFNPENKGTLITGTTEKTGVKAIAVKTEIAVINLEGKGMLGKANLDGRIFGKLGHENISVGLISQGSSERGVGFVVEKHNAKLVIQLLEEEFEQEIRDKDISGIFAITDMGLVTVIGQDVKSFSNSYNALVYNNIPIYLINNTLSGNNITLVLKQSEINKAVNVMHSQIFGVAKKVNIAIFGKGTVGGSLIDQVLQSKNQILKRKEIKLNIFAVAGTKKILFAKKGIDENWRNEYEKQGSKNKSVQQVIDFAKENHFENLIAIDNTASLDFIKNYDLLIENGFDLISSNKLANTRSYADYKATRDLLKKYHRRYLYETNVGAGLPLIDTIKLLHDSGENITRIKGVFSGSLSYIFNRFSANDLAFSKVLKEAMDKGFTEPDPREDLNGNDVARKLLILARELDLTNEFDDIHIDNLIPENLREGSVQNFLNRIHEMDATYQKIKNAQKPGHVLRYVGDLHDDLQQSKGTLDVKLVSVPKTGALGNLSGSDSLFEIYTESYGDNPFVIQGAGAGAAVTARGVFGDLMRIADNGKMFE